MSDLITVFMATKNRAALSLQAIESVLCQTYRNLEIIVVSDGSVDNTAGMLLAVSAADARLSYVLQHKSEGAPAARNVALRLARGRFVTGLDDDDLFLPNRLETLINKWRSLDGGIAPFSALYSPLLAQTATGEKIWNEKLDIVYYEDLFAHNSIGCQVFTERNRLLAIGGYDEALPAWQDLDTFMRLTRAYGPARRVAEATYVYRMDNSIARISQRTTSIRQAYDLICEKHAASELLRQRLFLQIFSSFYGIQPGFSDWQRVLKWRLPSHLIVGLIRSKIRSVFVKSSSDYTEQ